MPHTEPREDEFADLCGVDEFHLGWLDGVWGETPRALCHPDPVFASNYRRGYLEGRRHIEGQPPVTLPPLPDDGDDLPF